MYACVIDGGAMQEARRKSIRLICNWQVNQILDQNDQEVTSIVDVSRSGLALASRRQWGTQRERFAWLQFSLPSGQRIRALGELMHERQLNQHEKIRGFRFKYIAPRERVALNEFMSKNDR